MVLQVTVQRLQELMIIRINVLIHKDWKLSPRPVLVRGAEGYG